MLLNKQEILEKHLILDADLKNYKATSYDIRIGNIISRNGEKLESYYLKPQGIIQVVSLEKFVLPQNITGYAMIKTSLSSEGILPLNIGIIDPGYEGYLSAIILNFSRNSYLLEKGSVFLRSTFHESKILDPSINKSIILSTNNTEDKDLYIKKKREKVKQFSEDFLNVETVVSNEANKIATQYFGTIVAISAFLFVVSPLVVTVATQMISQMFFEHKSNNNTENRIKILEKDLDLLKKRVK